MSEKVPDQASSKEGLDQLSALEESMAPFGMGDLDAEHGLILKDWSAQDFSNIYVRFRPHLISHARKFLREETQAEEVVQDAFLYLMTALPELDSELGVLRFLKWKTKMLCLDIIRSSQAGLNNNLVPLPDDVADETQPLDSLERADDAAIIRLALAKLNPRHREALVATIYEEKSSEQVAVQMGVAENALRQLLFRARASFRDKLIDTAREHGTQVSDLFVKRAASSSRISNRAIGSLGVLFIAAGFLLGDVLSEPAFENSASPIAGSLSSPQKIGQRGEFQKLETGPLPQLDFLEPASDKNIFSDPSGDQIRFPEETVGGDEQLSLIVGAPAKSEPEGDELSVERNLGDLDRAANEWASLLLTDLTRKQTLALAAEGEERVTLQVGQSSLLSLLFRVEGETFALGSATLSGLGSQEGMVAIPTGAYIETSPSEASGKSLVSLVLTGFAVSSLVAESTSAVLENSYFRDIAIRVELEIRTSNWSIDYASASFLPRL